MKCQLNIDSNACMHKQCCLQLAGKFSITTGIAVEVILIIHTHMHKRAHICMYVCMLCI